MNLIVAPRLQVPPQGTTYLINFTYESPHTDMVKNVGFNPDSSINIKYTLNAMRNNLLRNIDTLDELLRECSSITKIELTDKYKVAVTINDSDVVTRLLEKKNLYKEIDINNSESESVSETESESETESDSESESNSSIESFDDILSDDLQIEYIAKKYHDFLIEHNM